MKKINQYKTTYYKELGAFSAVVFIGFLMYCNISQANAEHLVYVRDVTTTVTIHEVQATSTSPVVVEVETKKVDNVTKKEIASYTKEEIISKIKQYFPRSYEDMIPVTKAESGLSLTAKGYNCYYNKKAIYDSEGSMTHATGTVVYKGKVKDSKSIACKVKDRAYAWSYDCGLMQMNQKSPICPTESLDEHLARAAALSRQQGKEAWSTFNDGTYQSHK